MKKMSGQEPTRDSVRSFLLSSAERWGEGLSFAQLSGQVWSHFAPRAVGVHPAPPSLDRLIEDVVWDLVIQGVLRPNGVLGRGDGIPIVRLTELGRRCIASLWEVPSPHESSAYMRWLDNTCPRLEPVAREYIVEALATFESRNNKATVVMAGCAAESVFYVLVQAVSAAIRDPAQKTRFDAECSRTVKRAFDAMLARVKPVVGRLPNPLNETAAVHIEYSYDVIRRYRNDVGHPKGIALDERYEVFTILNLFPMYCRTAYQLIEWLGTNAI